MTDRPGSIESTNAAKAVLGISTLSALGLASYDDITVLSDWHRGGAETYNTEIMVSSNSRATHMIAKSCVKFCAAETVAEWGMRRARLIKHGANVPQLYAYVGATIVEEYVPYNFVDAYRASSPIQRGQLKDHFMNTCAAIVEAGFTWNGGTHDLRSRGNDCVVIDFGEDLGHFDHVRTVTPVNLVQHEQSFNYLVRKQT